MKNTDEKKEAINGLETLKNRLPAYSMFGDPNHEAIEAQIQVIEADMDEDEIIEQWGEEYDEDDNSNYITSCALEALSWLDGDKELSELIDED